MELTSTIHDTWKYFAIGSFVGFIVMLLFAYQTHPYTSLLAVRNIVLPDVAIKPLKPFDLTSYNLEDFNITLKAIQKPEKKAEAIEEPEKKAEAMKEPEKKAEAIEELEKKAGAIDEPVKKAESIEEPEKKAEAREELEKKAAAIEEPEKKAEAIEQPEKKAEKQCNMYEGRWIYMPEEVPSYDSIKCPFIEEKMSCQKNGRPDNEYEKWRWEARDCDLPLFNGTEMLERLRNKRVIFAGDSLNRNMWESLACLLYIVVPSSRVELQAENPLYKVLIAKDYNCTVEFYWSPFLVDFVEKHVSGRKVLVLDKLSPNSMQWRGADVMIFNSGHWWLHGGKMRSWDLFEFEGKLTEQMPIELAYERGMKTWATWIKNNVDPNKTKVFFRSLSAVHQNVDDWCYNSTQPTMNVSSYTIPAKQSDVRVVITKVIQEMSKLQVKYLNITNLSQYRRDAHPSVYRSSKWRVLIKKFENNLGGYADCSHWCLPGLPDTWNRLLYASLFYQN